MPLRFRLYKPLTEREDLLREHHAAADVLTALRHLQSISSFRVARCENHLITPSATINCPPLCLSDRIAHNRKTIVCPMIDVIDHDNFGYETQAGDAMRGAFDWEMYYKRIPIPPELQKDDPSEPFQ